MFKKLLTLKIGAILLGICMFFVIIIAIISAITGTAIGYENLKKQLIKQVFTFFLSCVSINKRT